MLLRRIDIVHIEPCTAEAGKVRLRAVLSDDVSGVMPYLASVVRTAEYNPGDPSVTLKRGLKLIGLHPREVTVSKLDNVTDAWDTLEWLRALINNTWEKRQGLSCGAVGRKPTHPLELWRLLPRSNCRGCGELTCMAFAARLFMGERGLADCPVLGEAAYDEARRALQELVGAGG